MFVVDYQVPVYQNIVMNKRKQKIEEVLEAECRSCSNIDDLVKQKGKYIVIAYWDSGTNINMATNPQVKETIRDMMQRSYDDAYDLTVINIDTGNPVNWEAKIAINLKE